MATEPRTNTKPTGRPLTIDEAAESLSVTAQFIRRLVVERRISYIKVGKQVRIAGEDLDAWTAERRIEALPSAGRLPPPEGQVEATDAGPVRSAEETVARLLGEPRIEPGYSRSHGQKVVPHRR